MVNNNALGLVYSFAFIFAVIIIAFLIYRSGKVSSETVRKIIHIGVSNWVFILIHCFDSLAFSLVGPVAFIILNTIFVYSGASRLLGMGDRKRDNGLIYFPISLLILVLLYYRGIIQSHDVIASTLVMGYGDGLAALIGSKFGRHRYYVNKNGKTWEGTLVMLVASLIVLAVFTPYPWWAVIIIALVVTFFEAVTPLGLDNITVPLLCAIMGALLC